MIIGIGFYLKKRFPVGVALKNPQEITNPVIVMIKNNPDSANIYIKLF